ncbi:MJ0042-type zinc finger domain-containing protein [Desulfosudis oleivorans]|nr:MJ0042-type zinc finger domain-containing protein [Desulfosudis oleivorans]
MNVKCPECGALWAVSAEHAKKPHSRMKCGRCGAIFISHRPSIPPQRKVAQKPQQNDHLFFSLRGFISYPHINITGYWSYPAFVMSSKNQVFWLHLILAMVPDPAKKVTGLFRPRASVITTPGSKAIVHIDDFWVGIGPDPFDDYPWNGQPAGIYPHETIKGLSPSGLKEKERALLAACEAETHRFEKDKTLSQDFCQQWRDLSHPVFAGFLNRLAPDFIKTLEASLKS